jgi:hypothetical protein
MASEPLHTFDPRRNFQLQGFTGRGATTTLHDASATGVSISGIFQAAEDFAVLGLYNAYDYFAHLRKDHRRSGRRGQHPRCVFERVRRHGGQSQGGRQVAAGNHTAVITALFDRNAASGRYYFYFDYLWPLVPQDVPDTPQEYANVSLAIDFDTDHLLEQQAARVGTTYP